MKQWRIHHWNENMSKQADGEAIVHHVYGECPFVPHLWKKIDIN